MKKIIVFIGLLIVLTGCSNTPVTPQTKAPETSAEETTSSSRRTALSPDDQIEYLFKTIERIPLSNSSCFCEYGYSKEDEALLVTFLDSGVSYIYTEFPYSELIEFEQAPSKGKYYNSEIKGNYPCYRED